MTKTIIDETFCECFPMWYSRVLITALTEELALTAARSTIGYATSIIMCSAEAGIERMVEPSETPDGRPGVIIQIWTRRSKAMKDELLTRLSQCAMTTATTNIFNAEEQKEKSAPIGKLIAYFGDGHQKKITKFGLTLWEIPVFDGTMLFEETFTYSKGLAGGLLILVGKTIEETYAASQAAVAALQGTKSITSFPGGICRAGSKIGSKYSFLDESTNHKYCPSLRSTISDSSLPEGAGCAYEIVINAINEGELRKALKKAIAAAKDSEGLLLITSANYGGELGPIQINLGEIQK